MLRFCGFSVLCQLLQAQKTIRCMLSPASSARPTLSSRSPLTSKFPLSGPLDYFVFKCVCVTCISPKVSVAYGQEYCVYWNPPRIRVDVVGLCHEPKNCALALFCESITQLTIPAPEPAPLSLHLCFPLCLAVAPSLSGIVGKVVALLFAQVNVHLFLAAFFGGFRNSLKRGVKAKASHRKFQL